jgi:hAT family C-terminal dimerisation region
MDYLPIQASSVPSERVFSSSAETDTKKRNRTHPVLMEALQMLKFALKKDRLNFTQGWITSESMMCDHDPDGDDLLSRLLTVENKEDLVDEIIRDFGEDGGAA